MIKSRLWIIIGLVLCLSQGKASNEEIEKPSILPNIAPQNFVDIPAGSFVMGCQSGRDSNCSSNEKPARTVTIAPFKMMTHEVTFEQWDLCATYGKCPRPDDEGWGRGQRPVINVSWDDIQVYTQWLKEHTGKIYRLPSEAEWEYAIRAGGNSNYSWGHSIGKRRANCNGCGSKWDNKKTAPVGSFAPNAFGLYDMHGNVWEWVQDHYGDYGSASNDHHARGFSGSAHRILRGGSWRCYPLYVRSSYRSDYGTDYRFLLNGFRLVSG